MPLLFRRALVLVAKFLFLFILLVGPELKAVIRDGGVDPNNLGQGGWIYILKSATNRMAPSNVASVTNENSMFAYLKSQNLDYVIVKAATSNKLWSGSGNVPIGSPAAQFTRALVDAAHANGLKIFGSNRSWGNDIPGEIAVADYVFQQGADGFIYDAESEWEASPSRPWITNAPVQAWALCSTVRSNWPTKFIAHNPYDTALLHFSFPFKEFGYWCDSVMPQVYHHSASQGNAIAAIHWMDVHYKRLHEFLTTNAPSIIGGTTIYWSNSIKPLTLMRDVYNGGSGTPTHPDTDVRNFLDYLVADPNCVGPGGYNGSDYFRSELHSPGQWAYIKASTIGNFSNVVNNIILDDARASATGTWTHVKTIDATIGTVTFTGATGTDIDSFGTNYFVKTKGTGAAFMQFRPTVITAGDYNVYQWHPTRGEASTNVPFVINFNGGSTTVFSNQKTNGGNWTLLGLFPFAAGTNGTVRIMDNFPEASGVALVDGLKMMNVVPSSMPAAPSGLTAALVGTNRISLAWTDNATNESSFIISRSLTNGGPYTNIVTLPANSTNYTNINLSIATTYYYVVRAANALGVSTNSNQATATTAGPPVITNQPPSQTVADGGTGTFTVGAGGTAPLTYRWRKNGTPLTDTGNILGAMTATLTLSPVSISDEGNYTVLVSNPVGSVLSSNATLSVGSVGPFITTQPANRTVNAGTTVTIPVGVNGTEPLFFQWRTNGFPLSNGGKVSGANTRTLTISNVLKANQASYSLTITNEFDATNSASMTLTVIDPAINLQPENVTKPAGVTVSFGVSAAGTGTVSYRWKKNGNPLADGAKISGSVTPALTITGILAADAGSYSVTVSNTLGQVTSSNATLVVIDPIITSQPVSLTNVAGITATFTVGAFGTMPIDYLWRKDGTLLVEGIYPNISGLGTPTLTITNVSQSNAGIYSVIITNVASNVISTAASLLVIDPVVITAQPLGQSEYEGSNITFTVAATGTPLLTYQWRFNSNLLPGQTNTSFSITNSQLSDIGNYSVIVSNWAGAVASSNAFLDVRVPFRIENVNVTTFPHSVVVNWTTTSNSTTQVEYGLTPDYGNASALSSAMVKSHSVLLPGLIPDTNYYFRVVSRIGPVELRSDGDTFFTGTSVIVDNLEATVEGSWTLGSQAMAYANSYGYAVSVTGAPTSHADFVPNILTAGRYDVHLWYGGGTNRSANVPVFVSWNGGGELISVNQTIDSGGWRLLLADQDFVAGTSASVHLSNDTGEVNKLVIADAARWQYRLQQDYATNGTVPDWWANYYFGTNVNAALDSDGDGYSAYKEYVMGSIPTETGSSLAFEIQPALTNNFAAIFSPYLPTRTYELLVSSNLTSWQPVGGSLGVNAYGEGVITFPKPGGAKNFYRLSVRLP